MKRTLTALCALSFAVAVSAPVLADCNPSHATAKPPGSSASTATTTTSQGG